MVTAFLITVEFLLQNIRKKEEPENGKHDKQFYQDDPPQLSAPGHAPETFKIKPEYLSEHKAVKSTIKLRNIKITLFKYICFY